MSTGRGDWYMHALGVFAALGFVGLAFHYFGNGSIETDSEDYCAGLISGYNHAWCRMEDDGHCDIEARKNWMPKCEAPRSVSRDIGSFAEGARSGVAIAIDIQDRLHGGASAQDE